MNENTNVAIEEPNWSLPMFWEDITYLLMRIFELIKSLF